MPRLAKTVTDRELLSAALEGLEIQKERIEKQIQQVKALIGRRGPRRAAEAGVQAPVRKRELSEAARKRIGAAQKRRWAEFRKKKAAAEGK